MLLILTILVIHTTFQVLQFYLYDIGNVTNSLTRNKVVSSRVITVFTPFYTPQRKTCVHSSQEKTKGLFKSPCASCKTLIAVGFWVFSFMKVIQYCLFPLWAYIKQICQSSCINRAQHFFSYIKYLVLVKKGTHVVLGVFSQ